MIAEDPKVHIDRNGCLRVFALDKETRRLRTWAQNARAEDDWSEHGDRPFGETALMWAPTVTLDGDGQLHLFGVDKYGLLWQITERSEAPNTWPGKWEKVPGLQGIHSGWPIAATNGNDEVFVFIRDKASPSRVRYSSPDGSAEMRELHQDMDGLWSVTPDADGRLVVLGTRNGTPVSGSP